MNRILCTGLAAGVALWCASANANARYLERHYTDLAAQCRGGYPDDPSTQRACDEANRLSNLIERAGRCYDLTLPRSDRATDWLPCAP